ncbi:hypothetical protein ABE10_00090 [Bacillus toyonensis]|nr:hypothetical protein [Bacillus toyonensis]
MVEHGLCGAGGVVPHAPRNEHGQYPGAAGDGACDDGWVIGRSWQHPDAIREIRELGDTLRTADPHHVVASVQGVSCHELSELPGHADDADPLLRHVVPSRLLTL